MTLTGNWPKLISNFFTMQLLSRLKMEGKISLGSQGI